MFVTPPLAYDVRTLAEKIDDLQAAIAQQQKTVTGLKAEDHYDLCATMHLDGLLADLSALMHISMMAKGPTSAPR